MFLALLHAERYLYESSEAPKSAARAMLVFIKEYFYNLKKKALFRPELRLKSGSTAVVICQMVAILLFLREPPAGSEKVQVEQFVMLAKRLLRCRKDVDYKQENVFVKIQKLQINEASDESAIAVSEFINKMNHFLILISRKCSLIREEWSAPSSNKIRTAKEAVKFLSAACGEQLSW